MYHVLRPDSGAVEPGQRGAGAVALSIVRAFTAVDSGVATLSSWSAAGWSSLVARRAHNPKVAGSNPAPAIHERPVISVTGRLCSSTELAVLLAP